MPNPPAIPPPLQDVANTARVLRTLADHMATHPPDPLALAATLRQLARDLDHDVTALREILHDQPRF